MLPRFFLLLILNCPLWVVAAPTILVYGDSLSAAYGIPRDQGWVDLLQQRLVEKGYSHRVTNASVSGETTSGGLTRFDDTLQKARPSLVIIELGANDGLRGLPVPDMKRNLATMIEAARKQDAKVMLLGMRIPPNYGPAYTREFANTYQLLAKQYKLPLLEFFLDGVAGKRQMVQEDGLHPTAEAQQHLLDNVWEVLHPMLGKPVSRASSR
ncbi:MAG TPA: arylesterase [Methylophilaceae bacterium]|jgi:acyl-CoA thioesterase-1|nr:arylesterase [Methylophilaceae bacterium]